MQTLFLACAVSTGGSSAVQTKKSDIPKKRKQINDRTKAVCAIDVSLFSVDSLERHQTWGTVMSGIYQCESGKRPSTTNSRLLFFRRERYQ